MFITNTLSLSCITCMQQGEEGGNKDHESHGKIRLNGFVPEKLYGGTGGDLWDDGMYHGVREITVTYGQCIDSIRVVYDIDDKLVNAHRHGGDGGDDTDQITLDYPNEFLVSVSGHYSEAPNGDAVVIWSLKFESNRRTFGPFGHEQGELFTFTVEDGDQIVGMKGRSGWYIDAIGFHISHAPKRKLFRKVKEGLKKAYDILVKITNPLQIFQCTCL
ncbi:putative jacalin-like lectin domain-containing protein [Rosa chinensis]|uniref:Putative jacalin-like lectin domain-containing protein n=1 Tax=Rosa chinensis TaxID=74649 RepID=A0A2P6RXW9_ROSCH|nr:jacalin-related lectin 19 isoform X1 [Rosa chinensis]PRQ51244.1 putative jacalin-like lectin domain-containing protein [Rosa chinensis]